MTHAAKLAVAIALVALTGCAASGTTVAHPATPSRAEAPTPIDDPADRAQARLRAARAALGGSTGKDEEADATDAIDPSDAFSPDAVHEARLAIARAALVDANDAKEQLDAAEQLQRELQTLMERERTAKKRPHRDVSAK